MAAPSGTPAGIDGWFDPTFTSFTDNNPGIYTNGLSYPTEQLGLTDSAGNILFCTQLNAAMEVWYSTDDGASFTKSTSSGASKFNRGNASYGVHFIMDGPRDTIFCLYGDTGEDTEIEAFRWVPSTKTFTNVADQNIDTGATSADIAGPMRILDDPDNADLLWILFASDDDGSEYISEITFDYSTDTFATADTRISTGHQPDRGAHWCPKYTHGLTTSRGQYWYPDQDLVDDGPINQLRETSRETYTFDNDAAVGSRMVLDTAWASTIPVEGLSFTFGGWYSPKSDIFVYGTTDANSVGFSISSNNNPTVLGDWTKYSSATDYPSLAPTWTGNAMWWFFDSFNEVAYCAWIENLADQEIHSLKYDIATDAWTFTNHGVIDAPTLNCNYLFGSASHVFLDSNGIMNFRLVHQIRDTSLNEHLGWTEIASFALNQAPTATFTEPEDGTAIQSRNAVTLKWTYSDPDSDPQGHYRIRRVVDATTTTYWDGDTSSWVSTEAAGTKIASAVAQFQLSANWGDASTETSHAYSVQVWDDQGNTAGYTDTVTIYPSSSVSTVKGYSLPRPIKRQEDINTTLRSNQDYSVSWINSYVPSYGDLNDDLYLKGGLRPSSTTRMRNMYPPVVGSFSLGNATNYFQDMAATNVYRTNEIALSSERMKTFRDKKWNMALQMVLELPVEEFTYNEETRNGPVSHHLGLVAEDVEYWLRRHYDTDRDSPFISLDEDGVPYLHADQLVMVLWQAVQELYAEVQALQPPGLVRNISVVNRAKHKKRTNNDI